MFIVSPVEGKGRMGSAQIGEYFRVFVSYGIIALVLVMHEWRREREKRAERANEIANGKGETIGEERRRVVEGKITNPSIDTMRLILEY